MRHVEHSQYLPEDHEIAALVGRGDGPRVVALRRGELVDITAHVGCMFSPGKG